MPNRVLEMPDRRRPFAPSFHEHVFKLDSLRGETPGKSVVVAFLALFFMAGW
jgi:hypothetical protein